MLLIRACPTSRANTTRSTFRRRSSARWTAKQRVVLPELDGPTMAVEVFSGMVKLTSCRTCPSASDRRPYSHTRTEKHPLRADPISTIRAHARRGSFSNSQLLLFYLIFQFFPSRPQAVDAGKDLRGLERKPRVVHTKESDEQPQAGHQNHQLPQGTADHVDCAIAKTGGKVAASDAKSPCGQMLAGAWIMR